MSCCFLCGLQAHWCVQKTTKHATADRRTHARSTETAYNRLSSTKPLSPGTTTTRPKHTLDLLKTTSRRDTETTPPHSYTRLRNSTELSKHIWTLKDSKIDHFFSWRILSSSSPYNSASKRCNLCLKEKFLIICRHKLSTPNKRNELVSSCRHRNKGLLRNS